MVRMHLGFVWVLGAVVAVAYAGIAAPKACAQSTEIVYQGNLSDGVPVFGSVSSQGTSDGPELATYYSFFGQQGEEVTLSVLRGESDFDPALWVYEGLFEDSSEIGDVFSQEDPRFVAFADDEIPNAGPFGDPSATFTLPSPGIAVYTVAVVNFLSGPDDGGDGGFDFNLTVDGNVVAVPEPSSLMMIGAGSLALLCRRRR